MYDCVIASKATLYIAIIMCIEGICLKILEKYYYKNSKHLQNYFMIIFILLRLKKLKKLDFLYFHTFILHILLCKQRYDKVINNFVVKALPISWM